MADAGPFLQAAQSVASSIAALARPAVGGARWQTRSYTGQPHYSTAVFGGTAGVVFLFADLARLTGDPSPREIGEAAAMWVDAASKPDLTSRQADPSLYFGIAGHGQMCLLLYEATGRERWLRDARARARALARAQFPDAHVMSGAAGCAIFLLRLHQAAPSDSLLDAAVRAGQYIQQTAARDQQGARWIWRRPDGEFFASGFAHGASGIAYALAELWRFTGDPAYRALALEAQAWLEATAIQTPWGIGWGRWPDDHHRPRVQWCHGPPGVGLFAARAAEIFHDAALLDLAVRCAETVRAAADLRRNPSQCHGLAGNAELFVELARAAGDDQWLAQARAFGQAALAYRSASGGVTSWQGDEPDNDSPDFMLGPAGVGHFFLRLVRPHAVAMPLMVAPPPAVEEEQT